MAALRRKSAAAGGKPYASAFFIDTDARADKIPTSSNTLRMVCKAALVLAQVLAQAAFLLHSVADDGAEPTRCVLVVTFTAIFVARIIWQMTFLWLRKVSWTEVLAESGFIIPLSLISVTWSVAASDHPCGALEAVGALLFIGGTYLVVWPEWQRHLWKQDKQNAGRLFTLGLFSYSRHINYSGEILSFVGLSLCSGTYCWANLWIPAAMGVGMVVFSVPELETYLAFRYARDWQGYVRDVPCSMIPYVF